MKKTKAFAALLSAFCIVLSGSGFVYAEETGAAGSAAQESGVTVIPWRPNTSVTVEAESGELVNTGEDEQYPLEVVSGDWASEGKFVKGFRSGDTIRFPYMAEKRGWYDLTITYRSGNLSNSITWSEKDNKIRSGSENVPQADTMGETVYTMQVRLNISTAGEGTLILGTGENNGPQIDKLEISPASVIRDSYHMAEPMRGIHGDINTYVNGELQKNTSSSYIYYYEGDILSFEIVPDEGYAVEDVKILNTINGDETSLGPVSEYEISDVNAENAIDGSQMTVAATFCFDHYIEDNPLYLPSSTGSSVTVEAESGVLSVENGYKLLYAYKADSAGVYDVRLTSPEENLPGTLSWSETSGKIEAGSVEIPEGAGAVDFQIHVLEQGAGDLIFSGDSGDGTGLGKFEITLAESDIRTVNLNMSSEDGSCVIAGINDPGRAADPEHIWANGHASYVYFGEYYQDADKSVKTPVKWRVLDADATGYADGHSLFLMSDKALDAVKFNERQEDGYDWLESNVRKWLNSGDFEDDDNIYTQGGFLGSAFTIAEQNAISASSKEGTEEEVEEYGIAALPHYLDNSGLKNDKVFLLSLSEVLNNNYGFYPDMSEADKLIGSRSYEVETTLLTASGNNGTYVSEDEKILTSWRMRSGIEDRSSTSTVEKIEGWQYSRIDTNSTTDDSACIVPALNIDLTNIIFTTPAGSGKPAALEATADGSHTEAWTLTLKGGSGFEAARTDSGAVEPGETLNVRVNSLGTADTGVEYSQISAMIVDADGSVLYYGKAADADTGEITITVPEDLADGTYTLKLFTEDINGTADSALSDYASNMTDFSFEVSAQTDVEIASAAVAVDAPVKSAAPDTEASSETTGIGSVQAAWSDAAGNEVDGVFDFNTQYKAVITLTAAEGYVFTDQTAVTINGTAADTVTLNDDGTVTAAYTFPATAKAELIEIGTVENVPAFDNGTALDQIVEYLNANRGTVEIETEDPDVTTAEVTWTAEIAEGTYDPSVKAEQSFVLKGTVNLPDEIDAGEVSQEISVSVTVEKAAGEEPGENPGGDPDQKPGGSDPDQNKPGGADNGKGDTVPQTGDSGTYTFALFFLFVSGIAVFATMAKRKRG